jgi:hypothetical protein
MLCSITALKLGRLLSGNKLKALQNSIYSRSIRKVESLLNAKHPRGPQSGQRNGSPV